MNKSNNNKNDFFDIDSIPDYIINPSNIDITITDIKNENTYRIYKYVQIRDIDILLTNTHRIDDPWKKIESLKPLSYYLDKNNNDEFIQLENIFKSTDISKIKELDEMQEEFLKSLPTQIKYQKDYLWQIYYTKKTDKYVMIVPTEEQEQQAFVYLLMKKMKNNKGTIYVPICNGTYENTYIIEPKIKKIESILHNLTNYWPTVYEVEDRNAKKILNIIGKINVCANIVSDYKMTFKDRNSITDYFEIVDKLFYIQTELSNYYIFDKIIDKKGYLHFYFNDMELKNDTFDDFYKEEIETNTKRIKEVDEIQVELINKLNKLKKKESNLKTELLYKQKQISTFLQCKKTFFGKVKYYLKYSKKNKTFKPDKNDQEEEINSNNNNAHLTENITYNNDIEDLIYVCKQLKSKTILASTTSMDMQNITMKIDILKKKIENANAYIQEIESHKKSIFDFWRYTNKDEKAQLTQAETEKKENNKKIEITFNIKDDIKEFAKKIDDNQRKTLDLNECNSVLLTKTCILDDINNIIQKKEVTDKNFKTILKTQDFFGIDERNQKHREKIRNINNILNISKNSTFEEYLTQLKKNVTFLKKSLEKSTSEAIIPAYSLAAPEKKICRFELDPKKLFDSSSNVTLYKTNLKQKNHIIAYSNIIFYDNRNETLPLGMDYSTEILVDLRKQKLEQAKETTNNIIDLNKNIITKLNIKEFNV